MLTVGPLLLLSATVWLCKMVSRLSRALSGQPVRYADYYRSHLAPMVPLFLAVLLAIFWTLFFRVGQYLLWFAFLPFIMLGTSGFPGLRRLPCFSAFFLSAAFVFACAAPAYYYSFSLSPLSMLMSSPLWVLVCVVLLFYNIRSRGTGGSAVGSVFQSICLLLIFVYCLLGLLRDPSYTHGFYLTIAAAVACLQALSRARSRLREDVWYAIGWPLLALPALLGIIVFAPEAW